MGVFPGTWLVLVVSVELHTLGSVLRKWQHNVYQRELGNYATWAHSQKAEGTTQMDEMKIQKLKTAMRKWTW